VIDPKGINDPRQRPSRIRRLVVIAGPSGSGKSTVITRMFDGTATALNAALQFDPKDAWESADTYRMGGTEGKAIDQLIVHYDCIRLSGIFPKLRDFLPPIMAVARHISFVTLWLSSPVLLARMQDRKTRILTNKENLATDSLLHRYAMANKIERLYGDPLQVSVLYQKWFQECHGYPNAPHWLVDTSNKDLTAPLEIQRWRGELNEIAGGAALR
jgi:hypothetical protein